jgi:hypothetical protein
MVLTCSPDVVSGRGDMGAVPVALEMVDTNKDKQVSDDEFEYGCEKGWVQEKPSKPADASGGGQTPAAPEKPQP